METRETEGEGGLAPKGGAMETRACVPPAAAPRSPLAAYALVLVAFVAIASALRWSWYPLFVDTYYHMAAIQGMEQAGGLPTWAFWELAPAGRAHIYPPSLHVLGYLATLVGITPEAFITVVSWILYPAFLLTTWIWLRRVAGPRAALIATILLCGPGAVFWNQTTFNANALAMTLAPLALLALESERFLLCAVLNLLAATAHPMGLFLPAALAINAVLRRKRLLAGLLAAGIPVLVYGPWLAHIWANRVYLPEARTGGDISIQGIGAPFGANIGVALGACAGVGLVAIALRRRESLGLLGPALGFLVVLPMGFGARFLQFNIHWPLAAIGGLGAAWLLDRLERGAPWRRAAAQVASVGLAFLVLSTWVAVVVPMPRFGPGGPVPAGARDGRRPLRLAGPGGPGLRLEIEPSALAKLLDPAGRPAPAGGGPGPAAGPGAGPLPAGRGALPGARARGAGGGRGPIAGGVGPNVPAGRGGMAGPGAAGGRGPGGPAGPGGMDMIHEPGAREFFEAVSTNVRPGEVIFLGNPPAASLVTGVTGRWTTSGILRDVRSPKPPAKPEECELFATVGGGLPAGPGAGPAARAGAPGGRGRSEEPAGLGPPDGFEWVFGNSFGSLWRNPAPGVARTPAKAAVSPAALLVLAVAGIAIGVLDLVLARDRVRARLAIAAGALIAATVCLAPLAIAAAGELLHPPEAPPPDSGPFPGMPPGIGAGGPGPGGPAIPDDVPVAVRERYDRIQRAIFEHLAAGDDPRAFWAPEDEEQFRRALDEGSAQDAEALIGDGIRRLDEFEGAKPAAPDGPGG